MARERALGGGAPERRVMTADTMPGVERLATGISGLDDITHGGLPKGRMTLIAGTAGSGKTVVCGQFLAAGVAQGEPGVLVTFEERPADIRQNLSSFKWDVAAWEAN